MTSGKADIAERTVAFSLRIIRLFRELDKDSVGRVIGNQLLRSAVDLKVSLELRVKS